MEHQTKTLKYKFIFPKETDTFFKRTFEEFIKI